MSDLGELLAQTIAAARGPMKTAIPATVLAYNPALQTVTAKPSISGRYQDPDTGLLIPFPLPAVANVPVAFPSSAGFAITWPLVPGDPVFLVIADRSIDEWKSSGAPENVPLDTRRFDLTDAIAIPGLRPFTRPIPATGWSPTAMVLEGVDIRLGSSAALSPVALAPLVSSVLSALQAWLATHTHSGVTTGTGASGPPVGPPPVPGSVAAVKVKAE